MKLESYIDLKRQLMEEDDAARVEAFSARGEPIPPLALGLARGVGLDDYRIAVRTPDPLMAEKVSDRALGEVDIRIIHPEARPTAAHYQRRLRPLEPGAEISPEGANWMGTLGCFVRHPKSGRVGLLSNAHVLTDMGNLPPGTGVVQPFQGDPIATVVADVPVSLAGGNEADAAWAVLERGVEFLASFSSAVGQITGRRLVTNDDLSRPAFKSGRTTGDQEGRITAIDIDGLPVGYGQNRVYRFNNQIEVSGGPARDFSAGGDSGSLIAAEGGRAIALLFAGGKDETGEDFTYGCPIHTVLRLLGLELYGEHLPAVPTRPIT